MQNLADHPHPDDDAFLATLWRAKSGDEHAIDRLFSQFYGQVSRMVHARLANDMRQNRPWLSAQFSTGDVVQEVFASVLGDLSAFEGKTERSFAGYLAMVIRNRIVDAIRFHEADRRDGRRRSPLEAVEREDESEAGPVEEAMRVEQLHAFEAALGQLDQRERLLVEARLDGSVSFRELTDYLGFSSESAARRAYLGAKAKLAVQIHSNTDGLSSGDTESAQAGSDGCAHTGPTSDYLTDPSPLEGGEHLEEEK